MLACLLREAAALDGHAAQEVLSGLACLRSFLPTGGGSGSGRRRTLAVKASSSLEEPLAGASQHEH